MNLILSYFCCNDGLVGDDVSGQGKFHTFNVYSNDEMFKKSVRIDGIIAQIISKTPNIDDKNDG